MKYEQAREYALKKYIQINGEDDIDYDQVEKVALEICKGHFQKQEFQKKKGA